jgi:hypothetical protein
MTITTWSNRVSAEATRRREMTPPRTAYDDDGNPVKVRTGRLLRRLPNETHKEAASRHFMNARNDLWEVGHLDVTAEMMKGVTESGQGKVTTALGRGLGGMIGVVGDLMQGVGRTLTAGVHALAGVFESVRG